MSDGLNQVTLVGNLGADPELRRAGDNPVLQLRIATTESFLDRQQQRQERTEWHTVVVWGRRGEGLARILTKGSKICIVGSLRTNSWEANDGTKRYRTEIVARNVVLCGGGQNAPRSAPQADDTPAGYDYGGQRDDDDIPF